jgi:adenylate kinase family enzyme
MKYNRIFILGTTGSGKSTLARRISKKTNLPHYGLDWIVYSDHNSWKTKYNEKIRDKKLKQLINKRKWIIEGAYAENWILPIIKKSDLIIILQLPRYILMKRVFYRYIKNKLIGKGDSFKDMLTLLRFSYLYKKNSFFTHKNMAEKHKKQYLILNNNPEVNNFLVRLKK